MYNLKIKTLKKPFQFTCNLSRIKIKLTQNLTDLKKLDYPSIVIKTPYYLIAY